MSGSETGKIPPPRIPKSSKRYDAPPSRDLASSTSINSTPPRATASSGGTDARAGDTASNPIFTSPTSDDPPASAHSLSTKASSDSISTLPYLRDTPPRTRPANATQREDVVPPTSGSSSGGPSNPSRNLGGRLGPPGRKLSAEKTGKKRPTPLDLGQARSIGLDEELDYQRDLDAPQTGRSLASETAGSTLSTEMEDLSILRQSMRDNLKARPVDSPLLDTMSVRSGQFSDAPTPKSAQLSSTDAPSTATIAEVIDLLGTASRSQTQIIIVDTRPLGDFLTSHLPRSSNVSIPSLIFKRFKKQSLQSSTSSTTTATWESLASFVSTVSGKEIWSRINPKARTEVFVLGTTAGDETARVLRDIMSGMVRRELGSQVRIIQGGWAAVIGDKEASSQLVVGEFSQQQPSSSSRQDGPNDTMTPPKTAPFKLAPPPIPSEAPSAQRQISHHPSMPSLRGAKGFLGSRRNLPSLTVHTAQSGASGSKRPPKLSLNLDRPLRSATLDGSFPSLEMPSSPVTRAGGLQVPGSGPIRPKSPQLSSFQALCHQQSKLPPSPSSFGGITSHITNDPSSANPSRGPKSPWHDASASGPMGRYPNATPTTGYMHTPGMETSRSTGLTPFIVSTILPSFLYLGPELTGQGDIDKLRELGVRRILNVAVECDSDEELGLRGIFDKYMKLPMRDIVEESGVGKGMRDACDFLDDARLHSAPTYVHCKAGKSRSVTVVLAYLIHANAWTLKTSYAYVAERRKGISPNIGFVAELMQFEEQELGIKQSGGVHGESGSSGGGGGGAGRKSAQPHLTEGNDNAASKAEEEDKERGKSNPRYMRESLPPTWIHSLDSGRPGKVALGNPRDGESKGEESEGRKVVGDDREVRKNGHWVHHRRAPVDRTTLQPGRRVSKAGLESLRPLAPAKPDHSDSGSSGERSGSSSPQPMTGALSTEHESSTPGPEGRLGWV